MSPWASRSFRTYFLAYTTSLLGTSLVPVALAYAVLEAVQHQEGANSYSHLGFVLTATVVPHLGFLLIGGMLSDRLPRKFVLICAHATAAVSQGGLAAMFLTGSYSLPLAITLAMISGTAEGFATPALRGIVHELIPADQIQRAMSLISTSRNIARVLGHSLAGLIATHINPGVAIAADSVSFLLATIGFCALPQLARTTTATSGEPEEPFLTAFVGGWRVIWRTPWILVGTIGSAVINLAIVGPRQVLCPPVVEALHTKATWGFALSASAVGAVITSVVMYRLHVERILLWTTGGMVVYGLFLASVGLKAPQLVIIGISAIAGGLATATAIGFDTALTHQVPTTKQSRVFAAEEFLSYGVIPISQLAMAPLAAMFGPHMILVTAGVVCALASAAQLGFRSVRTLRLTSETAANQDQLT